MALGIQFDSFGNLCAPVPGLLVSLSVYFELGQEGLDITFILYGYKASLELLGKGQLFVAVSLSWWLSASSSAW